MRLLIRPARPTELTQQVIEAKKAEYHADNSKAVWKEKYIERALLDMSLNKCCYCECNLS